MLQNMSIKEGIVADEKYKYLFSVETVNNLVLSGVPFRDAYKIVGKDIDSGHFTPDLEIVIFFLLAIPSSVLRSLLK